MPTTSNFGWTTPADTDLVKDGAAAIRTLGNGIDTSLVDLKGGTTGQVLSKASNTDLDFTWVAQDDSNAIQNAIVDAKGDLISATAADTPARLASSGVNGDVLTVDTSTATGLKWAAPSSGGMTQLATGSFASSATGIDISSIPGTYNELLLFFDGFSIAAGTGVYGVRFNNDSGSNYSRAYAAPGGTAVNGEQAATYISICDAVSNTLLDQGGYIRVTNYANTTGKKTMLCQIAKQSDVLMLTSGMWNSTAAINRIQLITSASTFDQGTYTLYGVK